MVAPRIAKVSNPLALALLLFMGFLGYGSTFDFPFQFDDEPTITLNPAVKDLGDLSRIWSFYPPRFIGIWSFALNYHFGSLNPVGYHLVNFILHILVAFLVFKFTESILVAAAVGVDKSQDEPDNEPPESLRRSICALFVALVFVAHPIQTQAVTYITQRFALLSAFFYLLSISFYLKIILNTAADRKKTATPICFTVAFCAAVLSMFCKQNAFTLPLAIALLELLFGGRAAEKTKGRFLRLAPFLLLLVVIPVTIWLGGDFDKNKILALEENRPSRGQYFLTQFSVMITYLRLLLFPVNQNLGYDYPVASHFFSWPVLGSFLLLAGILMLAFRLFKTQRPVSFGILFFFLALAVESSFIPLDNLIYEHRLYLPSMGFFMAILFCLFYGNRKPGSLKEMILLLGLMVVVLVARTNDRNQVWKDEVTLWTDVVTQSPGNDRGHSNLGTALAFRGASGPAVVEFNRALALNPQNLKARFNLGVTYFGNGWTEKAIEHYRLVLALDPEHAPAWYNLGVAYARLGRKEEAAGYYRKALVINPRHAKAHNNLAVFYHFRGEFPKAIEHADRARQEGYPVHPKFLEMLKPHRK